MFTRNELKTYREWEELADKEKDANRHDIGYDHDIVNHTIRMQMGDFDLDPADFDIRWSLNYCQGDGCSFSGTIDVTPELLKKLDKNGKYGEFARVLEQIKVLPIDIKRTNFRYAHPYTVTPTFDYAHFGDGSEDKAELEAGLFCDDEFRSFIDEICHAMERAGYDEIDYLLSDENCSEICECNGVLFDERGKPHWGLRDEFAEAV